MKTLIVAATLFELQPFLEHFKLHKSDLIETEQFDVLISGVGMVATAFSLGKNLNNYNRVINVGIAGSFEKDRKLGELVEIVQDTFAELGAENGDEFISIDKLGFGKSTYYANHNLNIDLPKVKGITVNKVTGSDNTARIISEIFHAQTESMEGASVFYAANKINIECIQVRSISNYIEHRDRDKWKIGLAVEKLNNWLIDFVAYLK